MSAAPAARCAACGASLAERQRWCLACGTAAFGHLATARHWAVAAAAGTLIAALALAGIGYAVATLLSS